MKKIVRTVLLVLLCLMLSGCRIRTNVDWQPGQEFPEETAEGMPVSLSASLPDDGTDADDRTDEQEKNEEPGEQTKENPEASRKEYDETKPAEILPGTERTVHGSGEGDGLSTFGDPADQAAAKLDGQAEKTATRKIAAEEAEQMGVSEEAKEADSAMTYYSVLIQDRMGSLFECQRLDIYWETTEDHITVFKTSPEHNLILNAGANDVSARLLETNLRVDDGWIGRKNPGVIVKAVSRNVLGTGVFSTAAAGRIYAGLLARDGWSALDAVRNNRVLLLSEELLESPHLQLAAVLMVAKTANPDQFADVDIDNMLAMLGEEAAGSIPSGMFYYNGQEGFR